MQTHHYGWVFYFPMTAKEELRKVLALLRQEKQEDYEQYRQKMLGTSVAEKKKRGVCWYPIVIRKNYLGRGEMLIVEIEKTNDFQESHVFQSGKVIRLFSNAYDGEAVSGVVNYVKGHTMAVTLNADDLPDWTRDGKLGIDLLFDEASYKEMEVAMRKVIDADGGRIEQLIQILLGKKAASFREIPPIVNENLNASQHEALLQVVAAEDVAIIHGPPGTGKTTTLVAAIGQVVQTEKQVLVCAPSNAAVDLLAEKLTLQGLKVVRLGHPARITENILNMTLDAQIANHASYKDLRAVKKRAEEFRSMGFKYKRNFGYAEREQRKLLLSEARSLRDEADNLEHYIIADILEKSDVVAATLVGSATHMLKGKRYKTVFIDEAAQALEPACWIPILKAERVVFAGDHCQLPPTIKSLEAARAGLSQTLFEKCIARNQVAVMLRTQYRMHEKIMQFSANHFYEGNLEAAEGVRQHVLQPGDAPFLFIDTSGCGYAEQLDSESRSISNKEEAVLLLKMLEEQIKALGEERMREEHITVGVISPYREQVKYLIELAAENEFLKNLSVLITINTIDAFQGQERDMIYISMVRSNERMEIGFLADTRRMNVAMTRARKKLVMVGDSATLGNHPFYSKFLDYVNQIDAYKSAYEFIY